MPPADPLQLSGTTIAQKYLVEGPVGEGGFAVVYRAMHLIWKRPVAIKAFKAMGDFSASDRERLLQSFVQEGAVLAELSERSAAICQARDVGTLTTPNGVWAPYMVLEWLEGMTLERALAEERRHRLPPRTPLEATVLLEPAAEALALAHRRGIAHRDVKPGNVFLLGDPRGEGCPVKLLDFGIAKVVQDARKMAGSFTKTAGQVTSFTPAYGAPEQFSRKHGATGPWTDVFALGLMLTEILSGREALEGDDLSQLAYSAMDRARRPTPRARGAIVDDAVEAVIAKAVAVAIDDRWPSVGDFWNALHDALGMPPMRKLVTGRESNDAAFALRAAPLTSSQPDDVSRPRRSDPSPSLATATRTTHGRGRGGKATRAIGVAAIVAAAAAGVFAVSRPSSSASPSAARSPSAAPSAPPPSAAGGARASSCPEGMVAIPGGKFFMGSDDKTDLPTERPAHQVSLAPYCIDRTEVTTAAYKACSDRGECKRAGMVNEWDGIDAVERKAFDPLCNARDPDEKGNHPINCVDWEQAAAYCKVVGKRLPTEAEWELAARGPDGRKFPWGDEWPTAKHLNACGRECLLWGKAHHVEEDAMYDADDGFATTAPVGSFPAGASRYGVQDVVGNVWEWVADWYAPYTAEAQRDPKGPPRGGEGRVIRGGAWNGAQPSWVRPTFRYHDAAEKRSYGIGFRCAADPT